MTVSSRPSAADLVLTPVIDGLPYTEAEGAFAVLNPATATEIAQVPDVGSRGVGITGGD